MSDQTARAPRTPTSLSTRSGADRRVPDGARHGATSSDLSVDEAILVAPGRLRARGLVTGTCIFRPYAFGSWAPMSQSTELTAMSGAMHEARTIAMRRLRASGEQGRCAKAS